MELYKHGLTISFRLFARIVPHGVNAPLGTSDEVLTAILSPFIALWNTFGIFYCRFLNSFLQYLVHLTTSRQQLYTSYTSGIPPNNLPVGLNVCLNGHT